MSYDLPLENTTGISARSDIILDYITDARLARAYDPAIMNLVEKVTAFKLQTRALEEARQGNIAGATQKAARRRHAPARTGRDRPGQAAQQEADNLEQSGQMSAGGTKKLRYQTRKLTQELPDLD